MTRDGWLGSADGTRLYWQTWEPADRARDAVILVHGAAEHGGRYAHVAERLVAAGFAVYALDHRGHGRSDGPRAMIDRLDRLVDDLGLFVARVREEHDGRRPFLVGHSLGGAVSLTYAIRHGDTIAGLVVSGPAVATEAVPAALKAVTAALSAVAPKLPGVQDRGRRGQPRSRRSCSTYQTRSAQLPGQAARPHARRDHARDEHDPARRGHAADAAAAAARRRRPPVPARGQPRSSTPKPARRTRR